ncbi:MAG: flagellar biosynthesis protein FlhB [Thermoguttaceae bacterium]|jgi:flagellar biosynthetic protein FlhB|nr:flagellar biosynthesis protein FlhB [Thermoguttaceae bacterium]
MPSSDGDKSQEATPHRRQKAREEGQVAKSQDLSSAVLLLLGLMVLMALGGGLIEFLGMLTRSQLGVVHHLNIDVEGAVNAWNNVLVSLSWRLLPIIGAMLLAAIVVNVVQVGFLFLPNKLAPDITRLDPIKGFGRLFSLQNFVKLLFGIFKITIIAGVAAVSLYNEREVILGLTAQTVPQASYYAIQILLWTSIRIAVALLLLALLDYAFQKWKHEQDLRMTTQEVREEMKNLEGDPQVLARRRQVQRELAKQRLEGAVPKADVVVTNPTELAVAIQYEPATMDAPVVVAKGAGVLARRIRQLALENGIPIVERKPLAQALFREVEVNRSIPQDKYAAVAEVLAYVYQLKGKKIPETR